MHGLETIVRLNDEAVRAARGGEVTEAVHRLVRTLGVRGLLKRVALACHTQAAAQRDAAVADEWRDEAARLDAFTESLFEPVDN